MTLNRNEEMKTYKNKWLAKHTTTKQSRNLRTATSEHLLLMGSLLIPSALQNLKELGIEATHSQKWFSMSVFGRWGMTTVIYTDKKWQSLSLDRRWLCVTGKCSTIAPWFSDLWALRFLLLCFVSFFSYEAVLSTFFNFWYTPKRKWERKGQ